MAALTHKGWFLLCPVLLGELESEAPLLTERTFVPAWWLDCNHWLFDVLASVLRALDPSYEPVFPLLVTGELKEPVAWP